MDEDGPALECGLTAADFRNQLTGDVPPRRSFPIHLRAMVVGLVNSPGQWRQEAAGTYA